ncbi:MAG: sigma-70 family RNA polymerase sigma factor [Pseudomonadota bacterium]
MSSLSRPDPSLALYVAYRDDLVDYASRLLHQDRSKAEDVVQEAWMRLSARHRQDAEILNPLHYMYAIVRNLALDTLTRKTRETVADTALAPYDTIPHEEPSAEDVVFHRDRLRLLADAIAELPERTQIAFRMYRLEEKTLQVIADHLGISVARTFQLVRDAGAHATRRLLAQQGTAQDEKK